LILIKQPTLSQFFILHSIEQYTTHTLSWLPQIFHCNQRAKGFADEDVFHINQLAISSRGRLTKNGERSVAPAMSTRKRALSHVMQFNVVVIRGQHFF
jgi:hypothetical protein